MSSFVMDATALSDLDGRRAQRKSQLRRATDNLIRNESHRARLRMQRLLELEEEQKKEDLEALILTEAEERTLQRAFQTVKTEFYDLDGLEWTTPLKAAVLGRHDQNEKIDIKPIQLVQPRPILPQRKAHRRSAAVMSTADLAKFSAEETIKVSSSPQKCYPSTQGIFDRDLTRAPDYSVQPVSDFSASFGSASPYRLIDSGPLNRTVRAPQGPRAPQKNGIS